MRTKTLSLSLVSLLAMSLILSAEKNREVNSWEKFFTEPVEKVLVFVEDKKSPGDKVIFRFVSLDERAVYLGFAKMRKDLKKHDYKIEDIEVIIHNHFADCKFSESDERQYRTLKKRGFNGRFLLYCHRTKKVYDIEEKGKPKQ